MILVDTSVWIDHLARGDSELQSLLEEDEVLMHPYIVAEIALGSLNREETIGALQALPGIPLAQHVEVMAFLNKERLFDIGLGYIDLHLLPRHALPSAPGSGHAIDAFARQRSS